jgi:D-alanine-D-alanine ligase-like ATP-grasp enzyme
MYSIETYNGPNKHSPYQSVVVTLPNDINHSISLSEAKKVWEFITDELLFFKFSNEVNVNMLELICAFAINLQHPSDVDSAEFNLNENLSDKTSSLALRFIDHQSTILVIKNSIGLAELALNSKVFNKENLKQQKNTIKNLQAVLSTLLPQKKTIRTLVREAQGRFIPIKSVARGSGIWMFGQGKNGHHFYYAASESDSFSGMLLQKDKLLSNRLIIDLGFPGVKHLVVKNQRELSYASNNVGFPLVVKPISSGQGNGVTANITSDNELIKAFNKALLFSEKGVIVEKFIPGNDYRIAIFGGKVQWVALRSVAKICGDGVSSIQRLISAENEIRYGSLKGDGLQSIPIDSNLIDHLKNQDLSLESILTKDIAITLSSIATVSKGGEVEEVLNIHKDNIEMAESIARAFRMDALGIDFISPDISISWRDIPSAVIEVNGTPGIFYDERARKILDTKFPYSKSSRIPSFMVVDATPDVCQKIYGLISSQDKHTAQVSNTSCLLNGHPRCKEGDTLSQRINAVLLDKECEAIFIENSSDSLEKHGLPLDYFDLVIGYKALDDELLNLLKRFTGNVLENSPNFEVVQLMIKSITDQYALTQHKK